jgi:hypothetical protein
LFDIASARYYDRPKYHQSSEIPSPVIESSAFDAGLLGTDPVLSGEGLRVGLVRANAIQCSDPFPDRTVNESFREKPEEILLAIISSVRLVVVVIFLLCWLARFAELFARSSLAFGSSKILQDAGRSRACDAVER